ncbi:hypothetical protein Nepgr_027919 [Nepenthes gracilis]|uniref:DUF642 domain-containing protein n=1 Tax=Nepenthes gracilis TaxID=150966 RepID=A0AAD3TC83_NEPGR|nr:hypothetical protein Nepgr_027919 [Nepenthes gracilis]
MAGSAIRSKVFSVFALVLAGLAGILAEDATIQDGPLVNGDFEAVPTGGFSDDVLREGGATIPGWKSNGTVELVSVRQRQGPMILIIPGGAHAVRLGNDAEISQELKVEKGSLYSVTFSAARTCAPLESLSVSVPPAASTVDLQTVYSDQGWGSYAWAFEAQQGDVSLVLKNPGMEEDPTCGPIIDDVAIKKMFTPPRPKENAVLNGDFEEGPWLFKNKSLGVLLPTNLDEDATPLPGWIVESNRAVRFVDSDHFTVPEGKRAIELVSGKEGIISQMVETTPRKQYMLTFSVGQAGDSCKEPLALMAFAGDQARSFHYMADSNSSFELAGLNFTAKAERTRIAFYSVYYNTRIDHSSSLCGPVLDGVRVWPTSGSIRFAPLGFGFGPFGAALVVVLIWVLKMS